MIRALIAERTDPVLFALSYDYVGDLSETVALMWPKQRQRRGRAATPAHLPSRRSSPRWVRSANRNCRRNWRTGSTLLDETGRWALLKLVTGGLRIGVSARLAKTAVAALGDKDPQEIELIWPGLEPPYLDLFAWLEGRGDKPADRNPAPFRPAMLAHAIEESDFAALDPADFVAEWKWDGIRVQAVASVDEDGQPVARLYSRTGEDISAAFPDLIEALRLPAAIDGELLILRDGRVQSFNVLQQRLNRKTVTAKMLAEFPAHLRAYDLLADGDGDLRELPFAERRARLEALIAPARPNRASISRRWCHSQAGRSSPRRAPIPRRLAPARTPKRSRA